MTALGRVVDLTVPIDEHLPAAWPHHQPFQHKTFNWYEHTEDRHELRTSRLGAYTTRWMAIDEHTGTHLDAPSHFVPPSDSGLPFAGPWGDVDADGVPLDQLVGPAVVIDAPSTTAPEGVSPLFEPEHIEAWEAEHGQIQPGEIVLFRQGWDRFFVPGPEGDKYLREVVVYERGQAWHAPSVETIELLMEREVRCVGTDGPTMGPAQGGQKVHLAALGKGAVFVECLANLGELPVRGATFLFLPLKVMRATGAPGRAVAFL